MRRPGPGPGFSFGSIIAFNRPVERHTVEFLALDAEDKSQRKFVEVLIAPKFSSESLDYLHTCKNLRVIEYATSSAMCSKDLRYLNGSLLCRIATPNSMTVEPVTDVKVDLERLRGLLEFGLQAISNIKSNAILLVREKDGFYQLLGMGAGQPNRLISTKLAIEKSRETLSHEYTGDPDQLETYIKEEIGKAILVSDAFFPFPDNVELAAEQGVKIISQPGGSLRDDLVLTACNHLASP